MVSFGPKVLSLGTQLKGDLRFDPAGSSKAPAYGRDSRWRYVEMTSYRAEAASLELKSRFNAVVALLIDHVQLHNLRPNLYMLYIATGR